MLREEGDWKWFYENVWTFSTEGGDRVKSCAAGGALMERSSFFLDVVSLNSFLDGGTTHVIDQLLVGALNHPNLINNFKAPLFHGLG
jgi:hypothetical protein